MKQLILFSLSKRFRNRMTLIMNVLVFVIIGLLFHMDHLLKKEENIIYLDSSVRKYHESFLMADHDDFSYAVKDDEKPYLHLDKEWTLYSEQQLDKRIIDEVREDIIRIKSEEYYEKADLKTRKYIKKYEAIKLTNLYEETSDSKDNPVWGLISVIYFIILSYSNLVANEVVYEKATNTLGLILTSVSGKEHFIAKILTAYLSLSLQALLVTAGAVFWLIERYVEDGLRGLLSFLLSVFPTETLNAAFDISAGRIMITVLLVMTGILTIQTVMLIYFSGFTNSDDVGTYQGPFYLIMVAGYYFLLIKGSVSFFRSAFSRILSFIPVFSMIFMPCRIITDDAVAAETAVSVIMALLMLGFVIWFGTPMYKKRILNSK